MRDQSGRRWLVSTGGRAKSRTGYLRHIFPTAGCLLGVAILCLSALGLHGAEGPAEPAGQSALRLINGDLLSGKILDSDRPGSLRWQCPAFAGPFDFSLNVINVVQFPLPAVLPQPKGEYCFELAGGDVLFGTLLGLTADEAEIDVQRFGRLHVQRSAVRRIYRWRNTADLIYLGPNGLRGWKEDGSKKAWREEAGQIVTDQPDSSISGDFKIPAEASIEFEISWEKKPDFQFLLGTSSDEKGPSRAFRLEVWDDDLVLVRETALEADVAPLQKIASGPGRVHLQLFMDQDRGRAIAFSAGGQQIAEVKVAGPKSLPHSGIRLTNKGGDVRLERLRIGRWNGEPPAAVQGDKSRIHRTDGSAVYGSVTAFDAAAREFVVTQEKADLRIAADKIQSIYLAPHGDQVVRSILAVCPDGMRVSGELAKVEQGIVVLQCAEIREQLRIPSADLHSLVVLRREAAPPVPTGRVGRLEIDGMHFSGNLVDGHRTADASCLVWQPLLSSSTSPLLANVSGRIVYRDPRPRPARPKAAASVPARRPVGFGELLLGGLVGANRPANAPVSSKSGPMLYLRTGDNVPCAVSRIDERGVTFTTPLSDAKFVPHSQIKALELNALVGTATISKARRERLLTLPRMQRDNPPTQIICSTNGDLLRGRLLDLDDKKLTFELRLETKDLPRDRISRIIWLHADELSDAKVSAAGEPAAPSQDLRVQALRSDGNRLTFVGEELNKSVLSGKSDLLGACRIELDKIDQLLIGASIEQSAAELVYQKWKLKHASEPKVATAPDGESPEGRASGTESALVGKPAIDFELDLLDGKKFHLSQQKDQIVVLDFWASWCGPCIQTMPQVHEVVEEFKTQKVQLVTVNLQESPEKVAAAFERLKIKATAALDRDGKVADKYGANAIPQTVIIDRSGTIARVFIGGGPRFGEQLREALQAVISGPPPATTSPPAAPATSRPAPAGQGSAPLKQP